MPTNRRKRLQPRRHDVYSERTIERLLCGHDWGFLDGPDLTDAELCVTWGQQRDELLEQHIRDHPGSRPWGWWAFDSPEPRLQVGDGPTPIGEELWFGMPRFYDGVPPSTMFETEADYLRRLGLLAPDEVETLE